MKQSKSSKIEIIKLEAKIEMIDYVLNHFCVRELGESQRTDLRNLKYSYQTKIDEIK